MCALHECSNGGCLPFCAIAPNDGQTEKPVKDSQADKYVKNTIYQLTGGKCDEVSSNDEGRVGWVAGRRMCWSQQ